MLNNEKIISDFRSFMKSENLDFFIINATDEYLNEYTELKHNARYVLTNFSGSTGDVIVTKNNIFLFVDGRYHLQADEETDNNFVTVEKVGMDLSPQTALVNKMSELAFDNASLGVVSSKISCSYYKKLKNSLKDKHINLKSYKDDPVFSFIEILANNNSSELRVLPDKISGENSSSKLKKIMNSFDNLNVEALLLTKLEEIAYVSNLRSNSIQYSSSFASKAIVYNNKCTIFCDLDLISSQIKNSVDKSLEFKAANEFESFINSLKEKNISNIAFDPSSTNYYTYLILEKTGFLLKEMPESPVAYMKSVKNSNELMHIRECFMKTDITVVRAMAWLSQSLEKGLKITEKEFSDRVKTLFMEEGALGLSFEVIAASGKNTAVIHYTNPDENKYIEKDDLILLDCGAYFEGGYATDITRTFLAGGRIISPSEHAKKIYTKVLKAFLNGLFYEVQSETTGFDIDKKVRDVLDRDIDEGFKFAHSTGHGVGISVHEAPPRLGPSELSKSVLEPGMCFTIEPGIYNNQWGGVRLENSVTLVQDDKGLRIDPLVKTKFDENLIDRKYLTAQEAEWLDEYQQKAIG